MRNLSCIYKIESPNGFYIGSAIKVRDRKNQHLSHMRRGIHNNAMLQRAFKKYGEDNILFSIVEECEPEKLLEREQYYIDFLKPKYNICKVAGRVTGFVMSEESKRKRINTIRERYTPKQLSEKGRKARSAWTEESRAKQIKSLTGRKVSPEAIEKTRQSNIGRACSPEKKAKLALQKGWKHKPEAIEKMRNYMTGRTGELCPNSKKVYCSNGMVFHGCYEAQRWLRANGFPKAHASRVNAVCRGERNKSYNLIWSNEPIVNS